MINFHKYGFLDCKRLLGIMNSSSSWLKDYNPIWLFVWSDLYKPEIAFTNSFIYIRIYTKEHGILYFPPLGDGDMKLAIYDMKEECKRLGIDFNMLAIDERLNDRLNSLRLDTLDNRDKFNYIYSAEALTLSSKKLYKSEMKQIKEFYREFPDTYSKIIKKDDFPAILEFINNWNTREHIDLANVNIYERLNMMKKTIEHLYELSLVGLAIRDENQIFGIAIASIINNVGYIHAFMYLPEVVGAEEVLISSIAKLLSTRVRYINFECDNGIKEVRERFLALKPLKLERYFQTFLEEDEG